MHKELSLWQRLLSLCIYIVLLYVVGGLITGIWIPTGGGESIWLIGAIGLFFFTHISAPFFVTPRDSLVNCAAAALVLATIDLSSVTSLAEQLDIFRWASFSLSVVTCISAIAAIVSYNPDRLERPNVTAFSKITYNVSNYLGQGEVVFSPLVLISIIGFYQSDPLQQLLLLFLWSILVFTKPVDLILSIVRIIQSVQSFPSDKRIIGQLERIDDPGIVRVRLLDESGWSQDSLRIVVLPGSTQVEVLPLFVQINKNEIIGTGICIDHGVSVIQDPESGMVYKISGLRSAKDAVSSMAKVDCPVELIGFVIENSDISTICFEVASSAILEEGWLVFFCHEGNPIYYQILNAKTKEEVFFENPRGTQVVFAEQLGSLDADKSFRKHLWVPPMNTPVFLATVGQEVSPEEEVMPDDFRLGVVPNSDIPITLCLEDAIEFHSAILGATGTGKTELAFDLIEGAFSNGTKIICVDFTGEYFPRLNHLSPISLGLDKEDVKDLHERLQAVETGDYSAAPEKRALGEFMSVIKPKVDTQISEFLSSDGASLGIFELEDIANTKATLRATELYLSAIFNWARQNRRLRKILLVLEEAHTIVPEINLFRFDKVETDAVVGRIAQIALQGRKYGVGLLILSQRTALVSKTILTQCHTVISFSMHDQTGLNYLTDVFGGRHVEAIPNLPFLNGVVFGKAVNSERPIIFQIPEDPAKREASQALDKTEE